MLVRSSGSAPITSSSRALEFEVDEDRLDLGFRPACQFFGGWRCHLGISYAASRLLTGSGAGVLRPLFFVTLPVARRVIRQCRLRNAGFSATVSAPVLVMRLPAAGSLAKEGMRHRHVKAGGLPALAVPFPDRGHLQGRGGVPCSIGGELAAIGLEPPGRFVQVCYEAVTPAHVAVSLPWDREYFPTAGGLCHISASRGRRAWERGGGCPASRRRRR